MAVLRKLSAAQAFVRPGAAAASTRSAAPADRSAWLNRIHVGDCVAELEKLPSASVDVVFADPPYAVPDEDLVAVQHALVGNGWLAPDAVVVLERGTRGPALTWVDGITGVRSRRYGETVLWYGRRS